MLSEELAIELDILEICKNSGDINVGDSFTGIDVRCMNGYSKTFLSKPCYCIGKVGDKKRVFVTDNKRCYFTVSGGWGKKDGVLSFVHLDNDLYFDYPTGINELRDYINNIPAAHSLTGAMISSAKKRRANMYLKALQEYEENKNEHKDIQPSEGG